MVLLADMYLSSGFARHVGLALVPFPDLNGFRPSFSDGDSKQGGSAEFYTYLYIPAISLPHIQFRFRVTTSTAMGIIFDAPHYRCSDRRSQDSWSFFAPRLRC